MSIIILCLWSPSPKHRHEHHHHQCDTLISIVASLLSRQLLLLRLSLPLSDKVKHYSAIALHTIKRQPYGSCQLPITLLQNMIISHNNLYHIMSWPYHITTSPTKTSYTSSNLLLQVLHGCYGLLARIVLTYASKPQWFFVKCAVLNFRRTLFIESDPTKVGETDTR